MATPVLPVPSPTFEDVVNQLQISKDNITNDLENLDKTITYFNLLITKGLNVGDAIPQLLAQKASIETFLTTKTTLLQTELTLISTFASQVHDQLPDLSSVV
jgi:hypothetical protein